MEKFNFAVQGNHRKALVTAMSEVLQAPIKYLGAPGFQYEIDSYSVSKTGLVTGAYDLNLFVGLAERGFEPKVSTVPEEEPAQTELRTEPIQFPDQEVNKSDKLCVEVPNDFTDLQIDNLAAMVAAKEPLLKKVLDAKRLPIWVTEDKIGFNWFTLSDPADATYYLQFIYALCETAKEKKRIKATKPDFFENEKFAMRVWLNGLGLSGKEYKNCRALLMRGLSGDAAWRYEKPEKPESSDKSEAQGDE